MDYASAPIQPILQGVVTTTGGVPSFYGRGCSGIVTTATSYQLTLDLGLIGSVALDTPYARTMIQVRAVGNGLTVLTKTVDYPSPTVVEVSFRDGVPETIFPAQFEIVVWRGDAGVEPYNVTIVGGLSSVVFL